MRKPLRSLIKNMRRQVRHDKQDLCIYYNARLLSSILVYGISITNKITGEMKMNKSVMFVTMSIVFLFGAFTMFTIGQLKTSVYSTFDTFNDMSNRTNLRVAELSDNTNTLLLATSTRVTALIDRIDLLEREIYNTILLTAQETTDKVDSALEKFQHQVKTIKEVNLPSLLK